MDGRMTPLSAECVVVSVRVEAIGLPQLRALWLAVFPSGDATGVTSEMRAERGGRGFMWLPVRACDVIQRWPAVR